MYEKMGYTTCSTICEFQCQSVREKLQISPLSALEYAKHRKLYLPKGSVLQENENLAFLQTQAQFYMGQSFLLAAYGENDTLHGIEFLGDINAAPAITHSLGYTKGTFRTFGSGRPFAMYHPFDSNPSATPTYFAFAFD